MITLNALMSLASAGFAIVAAADPRKLSGSREAQFGERYYARLYAIRSVPIELAAAAIPIFAREGAVVLLLLGAAAIQAADVAVAVAAEKRTMIFGASAAAVVHLLCALAAR